MINLIPPKGRKVVVIEYWSRVVTVWAVLVCGAVLVGGILLIPSFVLLRSELSAVSTESSALKASGTNAAGIEATVKEANELAGLLAQEGIGAVMLSDVVSSIDADVPRGVSLSSYVVKRDGTNIQAVQVSGVANSRETLTMFRDALEQDPFFERAEVPISDLVLGTDLPFTITITMANIAS